MGKWFYTGHLMADGKTERTVFAKSEVEEAEMEAKGMKPVTGRVGKRVASVKKAIKSLGAAGRKKK